MELPAHLSKCLFALQLPTLLVKISEFNSVFFLVRFISELLELLINSFFFVSSYCNNFSKHAPFSEYLKRVSNSYIIFKDKKVITFSN